MITNKGDKEQTEELYYDTSGGRLGTDISSYTLNHLNEVAKTNKELTDESQSEGTDDR